MFSGYDTCQLPPIKDNLLPFFCTPEYSVPVCVVCVCACVTVRDGHREWWTDGLADWSSACLLWDLRLDVASSWLHCAPSSWNKGRSSPPVVWACACVCVLCLSMWRESNAPSPCFPCLSAHLVVAMGTARQRQTLHQPPRGIVGTERRFKRRGVSPGLWLLGEKTLQTFCFSGQLIVCFLKISATFFYWNLQF